MGEPTEERIDSPIATAVERQPCIAALLDMEAIEKDQRFAQLCLTNHSFPMVMAGCEGTPLSLSLIPCGCGNVTSKLRQASSRGFLMTGWTEKECDMKPCDAKSSRSQSARRRITQRTLRIRSNTTPDLLRLRTGINQREDYRFKHFESMSAYIDEYRNNHSSTGYVNSEEQPCALVPDPYAAKLAGLSRDCLEKVCSFKEMDRNGKYTDADDSSSASTTESAKFASSHTKQKKLTTRSAPITSTRTASFSTSNNLLPVKSLDVLAGHSGERCRQTKGLPGVFNKKRSDSSKCVFPSRLLGGTSKYSSVAVSRLPMHSIPSGSTAGHVTLPKEGAASQIRTGVKLPSCVHPSQVSGEQSSKVMSSSKLETALPLRLLLCPDALSINGNPRCMTRQPNSDCMIKEGVAGACAVIPF